uniref:OCA domain-containing protein n=1 Tax=Lepisosteus oculatus TaxID=7918 RepID=W5M6V5_LEPOC
METEYSKRVYQGVRVKHTVKDLLAEKRSRQTNVPRFNGGANSSQPAFVQMSGKPLKAFSKTGICSYVQLLSYLHIFASIQMKLQNNA